MIRVLIADGDNDNRQNFKTFIKTSKKDFTVARALEHGKDVFAAITDTEAQLLIADIRFFGPSGISIIKKIHTFFPELQMILYGTFNDAEYLEKTAETGAVSYMFKPVKPAELGKNMDKAKAAIERKTETNRERQQLLESYKRSLPIFEDRFLINLVHGQLDSEFEFLDAVEYFKMSIVPPYVVFIVKIDNFKRISLALEQNDKQILAFQILNIVNQKLKNSRNGVAFINHISSVTGIMGGHTEPEELYQFLEELKDAINKELKISISIGVGRGYEKGLDIQISYKQAKSALRYRHLVGHYTVVPIDYVEPKNILTYKYPHKKEELLTYSAVVGDLEKTNQYLNDIFSTLREAGDIPDRLIPNIIVDIAISINRYVSEQKNIDQNVLQNIFTLKDALMVTTIDEGYKYLKHSLTKLCENIEEARSFREVAIISGVKEYVEIHYYENISLAKVGMMFGCVPEYLNAIFLKHLNKTYYEYVMAKRISIAKKLLVKDDVDDDAIAISIGYANGAYFRGIFLQHEGISVDEFRDLYSKGAFSAEAEEIG